MRVLEEQNRRVLSSTKNSCGEKTLREYPYSEYKKQVKIFPEMDSSSDAGE